MKRQQWSGAQRFLKRSPLALRCLKSSLNADCDGQAGLQELAGNATLLYYMSEEAKEGHQAFLEKRSPNFKKIPKTTVNRVALWYEGARPKTLVSSISPVLIGTAIAIGEGYFDIFHIF